MTAQSGSARRYTRNSKPVDKRSRRHRPGDQIALRQIGTERNQAGVFSVVLDALGYDTEPK